MKQLRPLDYVFFLIIIVAVIIALIQQNEYKELKQQNEYLIDRIKKEAVIKRELIKSDSLLIEKRTDSLIKSINYLKYKRKNDLIKYESEISKYNRLVTDSSFIVINDSIYKVLRSND